MDKHQDPAYLRKAMNIASYLLAPNQGEHPDPGRAGMILSYALGGPYAPSEEIMKKHGVLQLFDEPFFNQT